ncbi:hypothetical protein [Aquimarina spongiae]|uniref:Uncharacterized protein n=1 Tax=Aquimarina spongiae TaxID=570521 RepID=A0A1M6CXM7_9FLAO|nr:hypothetical protein [Aquimarina spongiae]SHI65554.1 hypothetical protein SAMN04488508_102326 [Aquimarina spongiae]
MLAREMPPDLMKDFYQSVLAVGIFIVFMLLAILVVSALISWNIKWVIEQSINVSKKVRRRH